MSWMHWALEMWAAMVVGCIFGFGIAALLGANDDH